MIKLKLIKDEDNSYIDLRGSLYDIEENTIGVREKFWIKKEPSKFFTQNQRITNMLFKFNRNNVSCEDWGEIFASKIGKEIDLDVVDYFMAEYDDGYCKRQGVLCGSYLPTKDVYEMSGRDLQVVYTKVNIDPETLETDKPINTVYSFVGDLEEIVDFPENEKRKVIHMIKTELLKQCLFDYILAQTDRHWYNTAFLVFNKEGKVFIDKAACYDNGCMAFLKRKLSAISGISTEIGKDPVNSKRMRELMGGYIPMFGVKTSTVKLTYTHDGVIDSKLKVDLSVKDKFIDEITDEILNNPDIAIMYLKIKNDLSIDNIVKSMKKVGDNPPPEVVKMIKDVIDYQVNSLEVVIKKKLDKIHREEEMAD